jgi:hypothetical protein
VRLAPLAFATLLLVCAAQPTLAAANPYGLNVAWTQCYGDGGTSNRQFACNTNTGVERLVLSFLVDQQVQNACGMEMYLQIASESPVLPSWWSMKNTGTCRPTAVSFDISPPNPSSTICLDWGGSLFGASGIGYYNIGAAGANTVTTAAVVAVPQGLGLVLDPGITYFTGSYVINHTKTVGSGSCSGCQIPACVYYSHMKLLVDGASAPVRFLTTPANTPNSQIATWQSGQVSGLTHQCDATTCTNSFLCATQPVSARQGTWGAVKALYR